MRSRIVARVRVVHSLANESGYTAGDVSNVPVTRLGRTEVLRGLMVEAIADGVKGVLMLNSETLVTIDFRDVADAFSRCKGDGWSVDGVCECTCGVFNDSSEPTN